MLVSLRWTSFQKQAYRSLMRIVLQKTAAAMKLFQMTPQLQACGFSTPLSYLTLDIPSRHALECAHP
jgi:hypothetical protein